MTDAEFRKKLRKLKWQCEDWLALGIAQYQRLKKKAAAWWKQLSTVRQGKLSPHQKLKLALQPPYKLIPIQDAAVIAIQYLAGGEMHRFAKELTPAQLVKQWLDEVPQYYGYPDETGYFVHSIMLRCKLVGKLFPGGEDITTDGDRICYIAPGENMIRSAGWGSVHPRDFALYDVRIRQSSLRKYILWASDLPHMRQTGFHTPDNWYSAPPL